MTADADARRRRRDLAIATFTLLPLVALAGFIARYRVDVFYWDQWELVPVVEKLVRGTLSFSDLWAQHNEHRPIFPRLALAYLARATGWNTAAELVLNVALCVGLLPILAWAMRQWHDRDSALPAWTWPLVSLVLYLPTQWENWLWGWQLVALLQMVTQTAGLALLTRRHVGWWSWGGAVAMGVVGTYSLSTGLLYWPIGLIALLTRRAPARRWYVAGWILAAAVVIGLYFLGFSRNPVTPSPALNVVSPRAFAKYLLYLATFVGAPLAPHDWRPALVVGTTGLALYAIFTVRALLRHSLDGPDALPFSLGAGAVLAGLLVGLGRAPYGLAQSLSPHYMSSSLWLWVSLLLSLASLSSGGATAVAGSTRRTACACAAATIGICVLALGWPTAIHGGQEWRARLSPARAVLLAGVPDLPTLKQIYLMPELVVERREVLVELRLWAFRDVVRPPVSAPPTPGAAR